MKDITKPERPVKELSYSSCLDPEEARAVSGGRDWFWFSLVDYNIYIVDWKNCMH